VYRNTELYIKFHEASADIVYPLLIKVDLNTWH